jgi:hypothetical protein
MYGRESVQQGRAYCKGAAETFVKKGTFGLGSLSFLPWQAGWLPQLALLICEGMLVIMVVRGSHWGVQYLVFWCQSSKAAHGNFPPKKDNDTMF